jgi:hypothetical protein
MASRPIRNWPERVIPKKLTGPQRVSVRCTIFLDSGTKTTSNSRTCHLRSPGTVDAPSSGCACLEFTLADDALPHLRRTDGLSRPSRGIRRNGRYCLCLPQLRRRTRSHLDSQGGHFRRRSGVIPSLPLIPAQAGIQTNLSSHRRSLGPRFRGDERFANRYRLFFLQLRANPICASTARPSSPYGFASVSSISKWL